MINKKMMGSSLIEVMIALTVTAIGLLGVLAMLTKSVQLTKNSYHYNQATILANDIMEAMRSTPSAEFESYITAESSSENSSSNCVGESSTCNVGQMVNYLKAEWQTNIRNSLPQGQGTIAKVDDNKLKIEITFSLGEKDTDGVAQTGKVEMLVMGTNLEKITSSSI